MAGIVLDEKVFDESIDLADELDLDPTHVVGLLCALWCSVRRGFDVYDELVCPNLLKLSKLRFARMAGWAGDGEVLRCAMVKTGWIAGDGSTFRGWKKLKRGLEDRRRAADRASKHRKKPEAQAEVEVKSSSQPKIQGIDPKTDARTGHVRGTYAERAGHVRSNERGHVREHVQGNVRGGVPPNVRGNVPPSVRGEGKGREGKGKERNTHSGTPEMVGSAAGRVRPPSLPGFARFWSQETFTDSGPDRARTAWIEQTCEPIADQVIQARSALLARHAVFKKREELGENPKFVPTPRGPERWLRERGWVTRTMTTREVRAAEGR